MSKVFMDELSAQWGFDVIDLPLTIHGAMLDRLIRELRTERLIILDSDAEVLDAQLTSEMRAALVDGSVYGSGFIQPSGWLDGSQSGLLFDGQSAPVLYAERPWIPFAMFRTCYVASALDNGSSMRERYFMGMTADLVVDQSLLQSRAPAVVHGDTGAEVHGWLANAGRRFAHLDGEGRVNHLHGVTRGKLMDADVNATAMTEADNVSLERLRAVYQDVWPGFATAVQKAQAV
jgi:hypothetical protein